jgi:hypothetical protein
MQWNLTHSGYKGLFYKVHSEIGKKLYLCMPETYATELPWTFDDKTCDIIEYFLKIIYNLILVYRTQTQIL